MAATTLEGGDQGGGEMQKLFESRFRLIGRAIGLVAVLGLASVPGTGVGATDDGGRWLATWGASPQVAIPPSVLPIPGDVSAAGFTNQTVRNIIFTSVGGSALRLRLTNSFGWQPVTFDEVDVGVVESGAALVPGSSRTARFAGQSSVTMAPGAEALSDPVQIEVGPLQELAVSLFSSGATGPASYHFNANQINYIASGDAAPSASGAAFTGTSGAWYFVDGVDVLARPRERATIVALGDSITDGFGSTVGTNHRWPNLLAQRILAGPPGLADSVVDEGISGNRVLNNSACFGVDAQARLDRDVLTQTGAGFVILLEGINDIGFSQTPNAGCTAPNTDVSAAQIIAAYQQIIAQVHARGLEIFGGTLTPFKGAFYYSAAGEVKRETVNAFVRTSGAFDGVIDFDRAVRDPANPLQFLTAYDSGDHLHPNDAGYQAMANAVNLSLFRQ
jgi:lysophospholipase L1-like esterase